MSSTEIVEKKRSCRAAMLVRPTKQKDIPELERVLDETELFPRDMLAEQISAFFAGETGDLWLSCERAGSVIGFCYAAQEVLTAGTWNMLAIAVRPSAQGHGAGGAIVADLEKRLRAQGQRVLIAETSGTAAYEATRAFYRNNGYVEEARIRDFWDAGDDKIVFWKSLTSS